MSRNIRLHTQTHKIKLRSLALCLKSMKIDSPIIFHRFTAEEHTRIETRTHNIVTSSSSIATVERTYTNKRLRNPYPVRFVPVAFV